VLIAALIVLLASVRAQTLERLLPEPGGAGIERALNEIEERPNAQFAAPLIDLLSFTRNRDQYMQILRILSQIGGEHVARSGEKAWEQWMNWYGERQNLKPPPGYTGWKGELLARLIDPRFREFLYPDAPARIRVEEVAWGGVKVDGIPALVNPSTKRASEAVYLNDQEPVFGVSINGDHRAYPLRILDWHEMANDIVGGKHVALSYCTLCGAGILFDTGTGGGGRLFGSSGLLYRSNKLMYDRETKSLWNQMTGEPVIGKLAEANLKLEVLPVVLTSWGEWKRRHPETKALDMETGYSRDYRPGAVYGPYFASTGTMFPVWKLSRQLPKKARVFVMYRDGTPKAWPTEELARAGGVVNDSIGKENVLILYRDAVERAPLPASWLAALPRKWRAIRDASDLNADAVKQVLKKDETLLAALTVDMWLAMPVDLRLALLEERSTRERTGASAPTGKISADLRNEIAQRGLIGETRAYLRGNLKFRRGAASGELADESGAVWKIEEEAIIGPEGRRLARLGGHLAFWFGWFAFHPSTEVYRAKAP
jgi:hypothetical protein